MHGARKDEPSTAVQLAAVQALLNSLEFISDNFEREGERNYIMQVVCEATQNGDVNVKVAAYECLVRIMQLYYHQMRYYMEQALFGVSTFTFQSNLQNKCMDECTDHLHTLILPIAHCIGHARLRGKSGPPGRRILVNGLRRGDRIG